MILQYCNELQNSLHKNFANSKCIYETTESATFETNWKRFSFHNVQKLIKFGHFIASQELIVSYQKAPKESIPHLYTNSENPVPTESGAGRDTLLRIKELIENEQDRFAKLYMFIFKMNFINLSIYVVQ